MWGLGENILTKVSGPITNRPQVNNLPHKSGNLEPGATARLPHWILAQDKAELAAGCMLASIGKLRVAAQGLLTGDL